jgi:hypothetical protein
MAVPDVEFDDFRNGGDGLDIVIVEPVTGIHDQPERGRKRARSRSRSNSRAWAAPVERRHRRRCAIR